MIASPQILEHDWTMPDPAFSVGLLIPSLERACAAWIQMSKSFNKRLPDAEEVAQQEHIDLNGEYNGLFRIS